jgi:hypothetical protein
MAFKPFIGITAVGINSCVLEAPCDLHHASVRHDSWIATHSAMSQSSDEKWPSDLAGHSMEYPMELPYVHPF